MKAVESHNKTCQQSFQEKYHGDVQDMIEQLNGYLKAQEAAHNTHAEHIGEHLYEFVHEKIKNLGSNQV